MAKTVGCADFNQTCDFRITAGDDEVELIEQTATSHALKYHPEFAATPDGMRDVIRTQIHSLMQQAHTDDSSALAL